jgi:hypothetical protein
MMPQLYSDQPKPLKPPTVRSGVTPPRREQLLSLARARVLVGREAGLEKLKNGETDRYNKLCVIVGYLCEVIDEDG